MALTVFNASCLAKWPWGEVDDDVARNKVTFARDLLVAAQCRASRNFGQPAQPSPASFAEPAASGRASRDAISASAAELSQVISITASGSTDLLL